MVEMIAMVLENSVVFVLDFPPNTACSDNMCDIVFVYGVRCSSGITVDNLLLSISDGDFAPVH